MLRSWLSNIKETSNDHVNNHVTQWHQQNDENGLRKTISKLEEELVEQDQIFCDTYRHQNDQICNLQEKLSKLEKSYQICQLLVINYISRYSQED